MPHRIARRFTLLDLLILVAATAAGFGAIRSLAPNNETFMAPFSPIGPPNRIQWGAVTASNWAFYLSPLVAAWTIGTVILRLRRPRPSLHRLAAQPGWVACCAAAVGIGVGVVMTVIGAVKRYGIMQYFELVAYPVGVAVAAAWTQLAATGRWRPEGSWIDRTGLAIGVAWLAMILLLWGRYYLTV